MSEGASGAGADLHDRAIVALLSGLEAIVWESTTPDRSSLSFLGGREDALLGYARALWLREGFWLSVVHPEDRLAALASAAEASEQETFELEYRLVAANGDVRQVRDIVAVARNGRGELDRLRGVIVDMTERRELEAKLSQAQKMEAVGQLAGGIAHDFNNLLTIASGHARRLVRREELASARGELSQIITATDRAAELTRQLLAFARRGEGEVVRLDANETLRALQPMLRRLLDEDIAFDVTLGDDVPTVLGDRGNLEQIVMNLFLNARDAMPQGGLLTVATSSIDVPPEQAAGLGAQPGTYLVLRVADTGTGIEAEVLTHIFEPFFTTKPGKGTGMGLATLYGLVEQAGGYVEVDSEVGVGTTFCVALPAACPGETRTQAAADEPRATVLIVEDEPALRELRRAPGVRRRRRDRGRRAVSRRHRPARHRRRHAAAVRPGARPAAPLAASRAGGALHERLQRQPAGDARPRAGRREPARQALHAGRAGRAGGSADCPRDLTPASGMPAPAAALVTA